MDSLLTLLIRHNAVHVHTSVWHRIIGTLSSCVRVSLEHCLSKLLHTVRTCNAILRSLDSSRKPFIMLHFCLDSFSALCAVILRCAPRQDRVANFSDLELSHISRFTHLHRCRLCVGRDRCALLTGLATAFFNGKPYCWFFLTSTLCSSSRFPRCTTTAFNTSQTNIYPDAFAFLVQDKERLGPSAPVFSQDEHQLRCLVVLTEEA